MTKKGPERCFAFQHSYVSGCDSNKLFDTYPVWQKYGLTLGQHSLQCVHGVFGLFRDAEADEGRHKFAQK